MIRFLHRWRSPLLLGSDGPFPVLLVTAGFPPGECFAARQEAFAETCIKIWPFSAHALEHIAMPLLDPRNRLFALADTDDILDILAPLAPALDWLWLMHFGM